MLGLTMVLGPGLRGDDAEVLGPGPIRQAQGRLDAGMTDEVQERRPDIMVERIQGRHTSPSAGAMSATRGEPR